MAKFSGDCVVGKEPFSHFFSAIAENICNRNVVQSALSTDLLSGKEVERITLYSLAIF